MPDISKLSKYLKAEGCKDGDIITFLDAGEIKEKDFMIDGKTEKKTVFEIGISLNGNALKYSPNGTSRKLLQKAWGPNTEDWVSGSAKITIIPTPNGKDMIIAKPINP